MRTLFLAAAMSAAMICGAAAAAEDTLAVSVASKHFRNRGQNEINPGIGLEHRFSDALAVEAGAYHNSQRHGSVYAVGHYSPIVINTDGAVWRAGLTGGVGTGYELNNRGPIAVGGLHLIIDGKHIGAAFLLVPPAGAATGGCVAFQVRVPLR